MAEKTEKATPHKLRESRRKGQVGQSQDVAKFIVCAAVLELVFALGESGMENLQLITFTPLNNINVDFYSSALISIQVAFFVFFSFAIMSGATVLISRVIAGWIQFGPLFSIEPIKPKFENLDPIKQMKNMFSMKQLVQLISSIIKAVTIALISYYLLDKELPALLKLSYTDLIFFWTSALELLKSICRRIVLILLIFSMLDFTLQKFFFLKQQRMSHQDIFTEYKQNEGDPHMKGHRRSVAQEILHQESKAPPPPFQDVEDSDFVLVNPTHYAIGLYYCSGETPLPKIIFKKEGEDARKTIEVAKQLGKPIVRSVKLTRTLFKISEEGEFIPRETLRAVAKIYQIVRELENKKTYKVIEL